MTLAPLRKNHDFGADIVSAVAIGTLVAAIAADRIAYVPAIRRNVCIGADGAAQESNLPSVGLRRLTGFEDQLGHRARPLRR